jgi:diacylglycerol kinase (ATP)
VESRHKGRSLLARPIFATRIAAQGLAAAWRHEQAFRLEVIACAVLFPFALVLGKTGLERAVLVGSLLLVLVVELLNSALETTLDRISLQEHPLIRRAKDVSSAAVGLTLVNAAAIWLLIFLGD